MRTHLFQKYGLAGAFALTCLLFSAQAQAVSLSIEPADQTVTLGDQVHADVRISGLGNGVAPSLGAFDILITYDDSILSLGSFAFGVDLGDNFLSAQFSDTTTSGQLGLQEVSFLSEVFLNANQPGSFILATVWFDTIGTGVNSDLALTLGVDGLSDGSGIAPLIADPITSGTVTVQPDPIPEPSTLALMATGSIGLLAWRRWKK